MSSKPYSEALEEAAERQAERITSTLTDADSRVRYFNKGANFARHYTLTQDPVVQGLRDAIHNYLSTPSHDRETSYILKDCMQIALEDYDAAIRGLE